MTDLPYLFGVARFDDADKILALYRAVIGSEYCIWDASYPGKNEIQSDLAGDNLFVLRKDADIIGAISVVSENELDDLPFWTFRGTEIAEIARVAVAPDYQGQGLARHMIGKIERLLKDRGVAAVHLLAARANIPACQTYDKAGYKSIAECDRYGHRFVAYEKEL